MLANTLTCDKTRSMHEHEKLLSTTGSSSVMTTPSLNQPQHHHHQSNNNDEVLSFSFSRDSSQCEKSNSFNLDLRQELMRQSFGSSSNDHVLTQTDMEVAAIVFSTNAKKMSIADNFGQHTNPGGDLKSVSNSLGNNLNNGAGDGGGRGGRASKHELDGINVKKLGRLDIGTGIYDGTTRAGQSTTYNAQMVDSLSTLSERKNKIVVRIVTIFSVIFFLICFAMIAFTLRMSEKIDAQRKCFAFFMLSCFMLKNLFLEIFVLAIKVRNEYSVNSDMASSIKPFHPNLFITTSTTKGKASSKIRPEDKSIVFKSLLMTFTNPNEDG